jgi:hypothetical protein
MKGLQVSSKSVIYADKNFSGMLPCMFAESLNG